MDLSQSALVWTVVYLKGHVWALFYSLYMHPNLLRWLTISFHERPARRTIGDTKIYLSFEPNSSTSQYREEQALAGTHSLLMTIRPSL